MMRKLLVAILLLMTPKAVIAQHHSGEKLELYINFESRKFGIPAQDSSTVMTVVKILQDNPKLSIMVEGHTDNGGDPVKNQQLSEERAQAVANAIIATGISKVRVSFKGWGDKRPLTDNNSEDAKARNRRVEILIL